MWVIFFFKSQETQEVIQVNCSFSPLIVSLCSVTVVCLLFLKCTSSGEPPNSLALLSGEPCIQTLARSVNHSPFLYFPVLGEIVP